MRVTGIAKTVQVDVCDGHFVPSFTWPYKKQDDSFEMIIREQDGLPGWNKLDYEFDLMVNNPADIVDEWVLAGATRIVLHVEAKGDIMAAVEKLVGRVDVGLALNIETPVEVLKPFIDKIQFVQCMGIDHVGFQGQEFDEQVYDKIEALKSAYPDMPVSVDGGVSLENAEQLIEAGADKLIVGSAIFNEENAGDAYRAFRSIKVLE
jgi:ribulose-phosphate 3-epimerase